MHRILTIFQSMTLLSLIVGCQPEPEVEFIIDLPNVEGGNPIVPKVGLYPFPSSLYEAQDDTSLTGRQLDFSSAPLPEGLDAELFSGMDGYSRIPQITTLVDDLDPSSLPALSDPSLTLTAESPVLLLNLDTGEPAPILVEIDSSTENLERQALLIRPLQTLEANSLYGVILTNKLRNNSGSPIEANEAVRALRDNIATDSSPLESQRAHFNTLMSVSTSFGVDQQSLVSGWTFHTRSEDQLMLPLLEMHDRMNSFSLDEVTLLSEEDDGDKTMIRGEFNAPNYLNDEGRIELDADGLPIEQDMVPIPFLLTIPNTVTELRPVIVYGHGFFSHMDETIRSSLNSSLHSWQMSAVSINFIGFNENDLLAAAQGLGGDFKVLKSIVDQQLQSQANFTALGRLTRDQLSTIFQNNKGVPYLDTDSLNYMGISNGGTQGAVITTFSPVFNRAALIVGGGGWSHMMQRASQWSTLGAVLQSRYPDPLDLQLAISLAQLILDPVDSMNYVQYLVNDRLPGRQQPFRVTMHEAVGDCQVSNLSTESLARAAGMPLLTPSPRDVWNLETVDSTEETQNITAALTIYDEGYPALPVGNIAPEENGAHESIRKLDSYHDNVGAFLESGIIQQYCDGPCDPN